MKDIKNVTVSLIGLGYVGLPLAVCLSRKFKVIGFDINKARIEELSQGKDHTGEVSSEALKKSNLELTADPLKISQAQVIIVTVPTPIDSAKRPDLSPVVSATKTVGKNMSKGSVVVYESTVYPGVTEEICVPLLEKENGLVWKKDFHVGYSPERINPGDKQHTVDKILKVVAGDSNEITNFLAEVYGSVITAGIHKAPTIKTAEAAKVIENTQRDLNIALMNELSIIFNKMGIDTKAVLEAAGTKWNFLKFEPGLVGGHCIGVDPYYLTYKAEMLNYHPEVILAGRRINDNMGKYVAEQTIKKLITTGTQVKKARVLVLGFTFKENVPDLRNTRVIDIINELKDYGLEVETIDPHASRLEAREEYGITIINKLGKTDKKYDAVILAVKHKEFIEEYTLDKIKNLTNSESAVLIDIKGVFSAEEAHEKGFTYWRL